MTHIFPPKKGGGSFEKKTTKSLPNIDKEINSIILKLN